MSYGQGSVILKQKSPASSPVTAGARNGLTITSGYVELGGTLIKETYVDTVGYNFLLGDVTGVGNNCLINIDDSAANKTITYTAGIKQIWQVGDPTATEAMRIVSTANLLLGTTVDSGYKLDISGSLRTTTGAAFCTTSGSVGIGTANPLEKLHVQNGVAAFDYPSGAIRVLRTAGVLGNNDLGIWLKATNTFAIADWDTGTKGVFINTTSGNIGINTSSPSAQLHTTGSVRFANFGAGTATFDASGNLSSVSDERLKDVQGGYNGGLDEIHNIVPIVYKWNVQSGNETEHNYIGFSAQNIQEALGEIAIGVGKDGYLSIQDRAIIATLVNAVQTLANKIDYLENQLNILN
jgi:hypothetical protein